MLPRLATARETPDLDRAKGWPGFGIGGWTHEGQYQRAGLARIRQTTMYQQPVAGVEGKCCLLLGDQDGGVFGAGSSQLMEVPICGMAVSVIPWCLSGYPPVVGPQGGGEDWRGCWLFFGVLLIS